MASPARQVRTREASPSRVRTTPSSRPALRVVRPAAKRRKRGAIGFWVFAGFLLGVMVVVLAAMYALLAQGSFEMSNLSEQQRTLTRTNTDLRIQIEDLSSTKRISAWADDGKYVIPASIEVITPADIRSSETNGPSRHRTGGAG